MSPQGIYTMAILYDVDEKFELEIEISALNHNGVLKSRTKTFELSSIVTTHAGAVTAKGVMETALDAVNEADLTRAVIRTVYSTPTGAVTAVGDVYHEAVLSLVPDDNSDKISHTIFSPADAIISGNDVIVTAAVQTYLDLFETGATFALSDGEQISTTEGTRVAAKRTRTVSGR